MKLAFCLAASLSVFTASAAIISLDFETPATGSDLGTSPLVTSEGTVTFTGEFRDAGSDPDFIAAGAAGNALDIDDGLSAATLAFDFDVLSISFIYGGNIGSILVEARDIGGVVIDSFFQASTDDGQPAGPITLSGTGIRSLYWEDPGNTYAPLDNLEITTADASVPEPSTWLLLSAGLGFLALKRRR